MKLTTYPLAICCAICFLACQKEAETPTNTTWTIYKGGPEANQYSSLAQIDTNNVTSLEVA